MQEIPLINLLIMLLPVAIVIWVLVKWSLDAKNAVYALSRMLGQLLIVGYLLSYIFNSDSMSLVLLILALMVFVSSWIALGTVKNQRLKLYKKAIFSIGLGGGTIFIVVTQGVLGIEKWYSPAITIPLAGMIFANCMNSVSLAAERFTTELQRGSIYINARTDALNAALIPVINSLFAVGLVSLPGMMTGQILSGVSPLIAVRYQIMVMAMIFAANGISTIVFIALLKPKK